MTASGRLVLVASSDTAFMGVYVDSSAVRYCLVGRYLGVEDVEGPDGVVPSAVVEVGGQRRGLTPLLDEVLVLLGRFPSAGAYFEWERLEDRPWGEADFLLWMMSQGLLVSFDPRGVFPPVLAEKLRLMAGSSQLGAADGLVGQLVGAESIAAGVARVAEEAQVRRGVLLEGLSSELAGALDRQLVRFDYALSLQ